MKAFKAFSAWYTDRIAPFSIAIRPFLRQALQITSLGLDAVALIFIIHGVFSLRDSIMRIALAATALLLPLALLLFLLFIATLQFDLDIKSTSHWTGIIPLALIGICFAAILIITALYDRYSAPWQHCFDQSVICLICCFISEGLAALYIKLRTYTRTN